MVAPKYFAVLRCVQAALCCWLGTSPFARAAEPSEIGPSQYRRQVWRREDGLPDNRVRALLQTRDGYLWIGTESGLARFDGLHFTTFSRQNSPAFVSADCNALTQDDEGSLWIGTAKGLLRMKGGQFQRFTAQDGLKDDEVLSLTSYGGSVWIVTSEGVNRWRDQKLESIGTADGTEAGLFQVRMFYPDRAGTLWMSTIAGLRKFEHHSEQFTTTFQEPSWADALVAQNGRSLWFRRDGVLTEHVGGKWIDHSLGSTNLSAFNTCMLADRRGNIWLGSVHKGLACYRQGHFEFYTTSNGLPDNWVLSLAEDREGNIWIGTGRGGLSRWTPPRFRAVTVAEGLPHPNTWTVCESPKGGVWIGTDGGLCKWENGRMGNFVTHTNGLFDPKIRAVATGRNDVVWIGNSLGLNKLENEKVTGFRFPSPQTFNKMRALLEDRSRTLWVGWERGLARLEDGEWTHFNRTNGALSQSDVRALLQDRAGNLWIGTFGGGVNCWRKDGSRMVYSEARGLTNQFVSVIHEDADGVIWVGTEHGLNRFKNGRFTSLNTSHGLFDDVINFVLEENGSFWISTDRGIYKVDRKVLNAVADGKAARVESMVFTEADGMPHRETNGRKSYPAGCKTRNGHLFFATTKGVVVVDPASWEEPRLTPQVAIEEMFANRDLTFCSVPDPSGTASSSDPKISVTLAPGQSDVLEFHYTANWLTAPDQVQFRYRLLGSHEHWIEAQNRRVAYYTDLRPGRYTFEVTACNHHGQWNEQAASLALYLAPRLYETWWFYALVAAAVAVGGGGLIRWRVTELRKIAVSQELGRISRDLHDTLSAMLTRHSLLLDRARRAADGAEPVGQHFRALTDSTRDLLQTLKETIWTTDPRCDSLDDLVPYLTQYATQFLEPTGIHGRFDVPCDVQPVPLRPGLRHHILLTVKEALHNVVQHAAATEVRLCIGVNNMRLSISIEDDGKGLDPSLDYDGNGLANMRQRMEQSGGKLSILSGRGQGTKIHIEVDLNLRVKSKPSQKPV